MDRSPDSVAAAAYHPSDGAATCIPPRRPPSLTQGRVLNADEVAALLRVGRNAVYDAAGRGEIPHRRLGRRILFNEAAVLQWLAGDLHSRR